MELTPEQLAVLNIFKEYEIDAGEYLSAQTLGQARLELPKEIRDRWNDILESLIKLSCITRDPLGYGLTQKGHRQAYHPSG